MDVHPQHLELFQNATKQLSDAQYAALDSKTAQQKEALELEFRRKLSELNSKHTDAKLRLDRNFAGFIQKQ